MNSEKFIAFVEKLLDCTKAGEIKWDRLKIHHEQGIQDKCFCCNVGNMEVSIITPKQDSDSHFLRISYDSKLSSADLRPVTQEEQVILLRLFNYVYTLFPDLETSIDKFLNDF